MNENQTYTFCSTEINHSSINLAANKLSRTLIMFYCGKNEEVFCPKKQNKNGKQLFCWIIVNRIMNWTETEEKHALPITMKNVNNQLMLLIVSN